MPPQTNDPLPFLTRKMLAWEHGATFDIEIITRSDDNSTVEVIGFTREGPFTFNFDLVNTQLVQSNIFRIPDVPISVSVHTQTAGVQFGESYATIYLRANQTRIMRLASGFISSQAGISYPSTQFYPPIPGHGRIVADLVSSPAANTQFTHEIEDNTIARVIGMSIILDTDANAADRQLHVVFDMAGGSGSMRVTSPVTQPANTVYTYILGIFGQAPTAVTDSIVYIPIPHDIWMKDNNDIDSITTNFQAGDDFTTIWLWTEKFFESTTD